MMWNKMEINWHLVTLFEMKYIHILNDINHDLCRSILKKSVTVSINTVAIPDLNIKVSTWKSEFPQGTFLHSLTPTKITRQRPFELIYIEYDLMKDELQRWNMFSTTLPPGEML